MEASRSGVVEIDVKLIKNEGGLLQVYLKQTCAWEQERSVVGVLLGLVVSATTNLMSIESKL